MRSINKVILIGNLTRDPELRQTPNGQNVVTFGLATNREWVTKDGRKQNSAEFHELVAWARLADICSTHLKKGKLVYIEGYLKTRSWDATDGTKKFRTEVVVQDMIMLDKKNREHDDYIPETDYADPGTLEENKDTPEPVSTSEPVKEEPVEEKETTVVETPVEPIKETEPVEVAEPVKEPEPTKKEDPKPIAPTTPTPAAEPTAQPDKMDIDSDLGL